MPFTIPCPNCGMSLAASEAHIGQAGKCSRCGTVFTIERPGILQLPPAAAPGFQQAQPLSPEMAVGTIRASDGIGRGFAILHSNVGNFILMGLCLFGVIILVNLFAFIPCIGALVVLAAAIVIYPAIIAGFYRACLTQHDGAQAEVGDLFEEFEHWVDYILLSLVQIALSLVVWIPGAVVVGVAMLPAAQNGKPIVPLLVLGGLILFICIIVTALALIFVLPALVDRRGGIGDALRTSWRLMASNPIGLLGAVVLVGLLNIVGSVPCCLGLLYTIPATFCILTGIYRTAVPPGRLIQPGVGQPQPPTSPPMAGGPPIAPPTPPPLGP